MSGTRLLKITEPWFDGAEHAAVAEVLASGQLVQAARVAEFERVFASEVGGRHAVMVSSGTAALHLALLACGIGPGDAVAVPAYTFVATANAVALTGAVPIFVDVDPATYNMDPASLRRVVERLQAGRSQGGPALRMVLPVHQFGLPAEMDEIVDVACSHGLLLIEDAACALGSRYRGRGVGSWGLASCFSFHPRKVITTGEGGAVVTDDAGLADRVRALRAHGFDPRPGRPELVTKGLNYRLTEMQAVLGLSQMCKLPEILRRRRKLAELLGEALADCPWFRRPCVSAHLTANWQSYVGVLEGSRDRAVVIQALAGEGIEARPPATAVHLLGAYQESAASSVVPCPVAEMLDTRALALPLHPGMQDRDVDRIAQAMRKIIKAGKTESVQVPST